jgi:hypothetical protein
MDYPADHCSSNDPPCPPKLLARFSFLLEVLAPLLMQLTSTLGMSNFVLDHVAYRFKLGSEAMETLAKVYMWNAPVGVM